MSEQNDLMTEEEAYAEEAVMTENPYCSEPAGPEGRPCIGTAGHDFGHVPAPFTDAEKLDYVFRKLQSIDELIEQAGPLLAQAGPLLEQAGPLLAGFSGQASSPLGRIAGSLFRS